ncbi:MAG: hypothetical protein ACOC0D_05950 [Spirochaeta sp.]
MGYRINYEDNIFFLNSLIKTLQKGMNLEIDSDYFRDKILEDILFLDSCLLQMFKSLSSSQFLITRHQHLRDLQRTTALFIDLLDGVLDDAFQFSEQLRSAFVKLKACRLEQERNCADINAILTGDTPEDEHEDTVSQDEFRFLLTPNQDNDD